MSGGFRDLRRPVPARSRRRAATIVISVAGLLGLVGVILQISAASALELRVGEIVIDAEGGFAPKELPKHENAPITLHGGGSISTVSGAPPPVLETIDLEFDRHGSLETTGLEVCRKSKLEARTVAQARHACPDAIVGEGFGHAIVAFPESKPINVNSPITLFNGPRVCASPSHRRRRLSRRRQPHARTRSGGHAAFIQSQRLSDPQSQSDSSWGSLNRPSSSARGKRSARAATCDPSVLAHAYTTYPVPVALIVPVVIERIHKGVYGYRTKARIPRIAGGAGIPISGHLKIGRKWTYRGRRRSYVNARCETGHLQARGEFTFKDGTYQSGVFIRPCKVRS